VIEEKRRGVAYILGRMASGLSSSILYDYASGASHHFNGIAGDKVNVYDVTRKCFFGGSRAELYDFGTETYIKIKVAGNRFAGLDCESNCRFSGTVTSNMIRFFDEETLKHYEFSL
jgi:hypothetical protein